MKTVIKPKMGNYRPPDEHKYLNYNERPEGVVIDTVVIHYTVEDYPSSIAILTKPRNVSAHYIIDRDGRIDNLVADEKRAWHDGNSEWNKKANVNDFSIGIELVNSGSDQSINSHQKLVWKEKDFFSSDQMSSLVILLDYLRKEHTEIKNSNIIGHSDITAWNARKVDPGICFDWKWLANEGHGLYSKCDLSKLSAKIMYEFGCNDDVTNLQTRLQSLGYKIDITGVFDAMTRNVVRAFNMHFHTDTTFDYEVWNNESEMILNDLLTQL
jgi:N-acetyl-anhydromuramyl-L-alanine amidase AmpD